MLSRFPTIPSQPQVLISLFPCFPMFPHLTQQPQFIISLFSCFPLSRSHQLPAISTACQFPMFPLFHYTPFLYFSIFMFCFLSNAGPCLYFQFSLFSLLHFSFSLLLLLLIKILPTNFKLLLPTLFHIFNTLLSHALNHITTFVSVVPTSLFSHINLHYSHIRFILFLRFAQIYNTHLTLILPAANQQIFLTFNFTCFPMAPISAFNPAIQ